MSAIRNSLPNPAHSLKQPRADPSGSNRFNPASQPLKRTEAQVTASRLPSSHLRRELRRWLYAPGKPSGSGQLRFAVPARIALQGEERASAVAILAIVTPAGVPARLKPCV